tara:strand:- start:194 stop:700 length:507 start_codon:yes stop_codon:yes gene_type:complete
MTIKNCILKTLNKDNIHVVISSTDNKHIYRFFTKVLGKKNVHGMDDAIFSHIGIHSVICLNKIEMLEKCLYLAHHLHVPLIILDCTARPKFVSLHKISPPKITYRQIALNGNVAESWGIDSYHDAIGLDITDKKDIDKWKALFTELSEEVFKLDTEQDDNGQRHSINN